MFDSSKYHSQDLLFKDATVRAVPVREKTTYLDWLGPDYVVALEGMLSQQCSGAGRPVSALALGHPRIVGMKGFGIKTLRKLKDIPGLSEAEEEVPISKTVGVGDLPQWVRSSAPGGKKKKKKKNLSR